MIGKRQINRKWISSAVIASLVTMQRLHMSLRRDCTEYNPLPLPDLCLPGISYVYLSLQRDDAQGASACTVER